MAKKQLFLYAGIGLAASGIATIFLIYYTSFPTEQSSLLAGEQSKSFKLEEVHANPRLVIHSHTALELWRDGQRLTIPAEIGIAPELWQDHSLDDFGPAKGLVGPMHTHDESGTVHIESVVQRNYTLGEFLEVWGVEQSQILQVRISGGSVIEDYSTHVLTNERLVIEMR